MASVQLRYTKGMAAAMLSKTSQSVLTHVVCHQCSSNSEVRGTDHAVQNILTEDVSGAKFEDHVFVSGEHQRAQELEAPLWEVDVQDRIPRVQLRQSSLHACSEVSQPVVSLTAVSLSAMDLPQASQSHVPMRSG